MSCVQLNHCAEVVTNGSLTTIYPRDYYLFWKNYISILIEQLMDNPEEISDILVCLTTLLPEDRDKAKELLESYIDSINK